MSDRVLIKDANGHPSSRDSWASYRVEKTVTFAGGTAGSIGDLDSTNNPFTIFDVTGTVLMRVVAVCSTSLAGAGATLEVGTAANTAALIAQTTATDIASGEIWRSNAPDVGATAATNVAEYIVDKDIRGTLGTANITAGVIKFIALWFPISEDGNVAAALVTTNISGSPSASPSSSPSASPSASPSKSPSASPSTSPSASPSVSPSSSPSASPSTSPSASPSASPSSSPSASPSTSPSASPSASPSVSPSASPSTSPSASPSASPSKSPSSSPSASPSVSQSLSPSPSPSVSQSISPSIP